MNRRCRRCQAKNKQNQNKQHNLECRTNCKAEKELAEHEANMELDVLRGKLQ